MRDDCLRAVVIRHWCSTLSALLSEDHRYETFAQMAYCTRASDWQLSDLRADCVLRYGRKAGRMRLSRRLRTALWSEGWQNAAFAQIAYCVMVSGFLFGRTFAGKLRQNTKVTRCFSLFQHRRRRRCQRLRFPHPQAPKPNPSQARACEAANPHPNHRQ